eukprot:TRINITY_DN2734_c0_g1_i1.p1 TRINITY_DN2734_c0_g1~~TRINITY_DN2734_c0_g1_i1.p1  ORF type:complete len:318 (-),score=54.68 TRINITY_DN2734_c0_g1_i1:5-958(-)
MFHNFNRFSILLHTSPFTKRKAVHVFSRLPYNPIRQTISTKTIARYQSTTTPPSSPPSSPNSSSSNSKSSHQPKTSAFSKYRYVFIIFPLITIWLGTWQLRRHKWKMGLINEAKEKVESPVVPIESLAGLPDNWKAYEFRRVSVVGKFMEGHAYKLGPRSNNHRLGYYIVRPFVLSSSKEGEPKRVILVNCGWVDKDSVNEFLKKKEEKEIEIVGLIRSPSERTGRFAADNYPQQNEWLWLDGSTMAKLSNAEKTMIYALEEHEVKSKEVIPSKLVRFNTNIESVFFRDHLSYVVIWYSLSAFLAGGVWYFVKKVPK